MYIIIYCCILFSILFIFSLYIVKIINMLFYVTIIVSKETIIGIIYNCTCVLF